MDVECNLGKEDDPVLQIKECIRSLDQLYKYSHSEGGVCLNLRNNTWMLPCSSLLLSHGIESLKFAGKSIKIIEPINQPLRSHLNQIGFPFGGATPIPGCSPIVHFRLNVQESVNHLLKFVDANFPQTLRGNAIKYLLSELSDNIEQHSQFSQASLLAQYFPKKDFVDIGILDNGISIPHRFEEAGVSFVEDSHAISKAVDGYSTKEDASRGYGLPSSYRIITDGFKGEFYIFSREGAIFTNSEGSRNLYKLDSLKLAGTLVYMRFNAPTKPINIHQYL